MPSCRPVPSARRAVSGLLALALAGGGVAVLAAPAAAAPTGGYLAYALTTDDKLTTFRTDTPGTRPAAVTITGLTAGDDIVGIDVRPATGQLYGLVKGVDSDRLVTIDPATGAATVVGAALSPRLVGTSFGVDFNPVPDRLRVVSDADQNLRFHPTNGGASAVTSPSTTGDLELAFAGADVNAGDNPAVAAAGYTRSVAGTTTTTLYAIETGNDTLVTQAPPNNGTLNTIGAGGLGVGDVTAVAGFDIAPTPAGGDDAFALLTVSGMTDFYSVDLGTGAATLVPGGLAGVDDVAIAVPRLVASVTQAAEGGSAVLSVTRTGDTSEAATVTYATADGTATAGVDYTDTDGTLSFAAGEGTKTVSVPLLQDTLPEGAETIALTLSTASTAHVLSPTAFTLTITDDEPGRGVLLRTVGSAQEIATFSVNAPGTAVTSVPITGLTAGDEVVGLDVRPATGDVVGLVKGTAEDRIVVIDPLTGAATQSGAALSPRLSGTSFGVDVNPVPDRLRVVSNTGQNLRFNMDNGGASAVTAPSTTGDTALSYAVGDANAGDTPDVAAAAYTNSSAGATATTLYDIDVTNDVLVTQLPPNDGTLNTVGALGVDVTGAAGLDIAANGNAAFAALRTAAAATDPVLYAINLTTGAATSLGALPAGTTDLALRTPGRLGLPAATASVKEGRGTADILVTRTAGSEGVVTVAVATSTETGDTAVAGTHYTATTGTLTFADGETSKTLSVPIADDELVEDDTVFTVTLGTRGGAAGVGAITTQKVTITDDDTFDTAITLATDRVRFAGGPAAVLSGRLTGPDGNLAGRTVQIIAREQFTTNARVVRTLVTAADGTFTTSVVPNVNTVFAARFLGDAAEDLAPSVVQVLQKVNVAARLAPLRATVDGPAVVRLTGTTLPAKPGTLVSLQRIVGGKAFAFDAKARVASDGTFALDRRLAPGTYVLRAVVGASHTNGAGVTNNVTIRVV